MRTVFNVATASLEPGVTLIEASAGTGKTFSLAGLILRLILEEHIPINNVSFGAPPAVAQLARCSTQARRRSRRFRFAHR